MTITLGGGVHMNYLAKILGIYDAYYIFNLIKKYDLLGNCETR